jgi:hypothetical protein
MDEAHRVLERLRRIEELREAGAEPSRVLGELRALLAEGEDWLAAERVAAEERGGGDKLHQDETERAAESLTSLQQALDRRAAEVARAEDGRVAAAGAGRVGGAEAGPVPGGEVGRATPPPTDLSPAASVDTVDEEEVVIQAAAI